MTTAGRLDQTVPDGDMTSVLPPPPPPARAAWWFVALAVAADDVEEIS